MQRLATLGNRTHGSGMYWYMDFKTQVVDATGFSMDALHVHVGMIAYLGICVVLGRKAFHWLPAFLVLLLAMAGEAMELQGMWSLGLAANVPEHIHDIANTVFLPALITFLARYTTLFEKNSGDETEPVAPAAGSDGDIGETGDLT